ncbi:MAG: hypothetical protein ACM3JJ_03190 [Hyphomicrobiales bacterium]
MRLGAAALVAAAPCLGGARAFAGSPIQPDVARADSATATLRVETLPPGLLVLIDGVKAGRSPVGPLWVAAKPIRVQAIPEDPRVFDTGRDAAIVTPAPGDARTVVLDLRPSVLLRSDPEPASIWSRAGGSAGGGAPGDSLVGVTPLSLRPGWLERRALRLEAPEHADTTVAGTELLELASADAGPVTVSLRRVAPHLPPPPPRAPPLLKKRWVSIAVIGVGAALTGSAALLRKEADRWYARYETSSDPDRIPYYYDRTTHFDRLAGTSLGTGQVLLTTGLFLLVLGAH